jgi:D-alanyl-lipoteichoic acid acyltransferase DltB (MBOAT superfamily)
VSRFILPENFRYPYAAIGFTDFCDAGISLYRPGSDYLYIPLGETEDWVQNIFQFNDDHAGWPLARCILTFVVWGALHGTYLCIENSLSIFWTGQKTTIGKAIIQHASMQPALQIQRDFRIFCLRWEPFPDQCNLGLFGPGISTAWQFWSPCLTIKTATPLLTSMEVAKSRSLSHSFLSVIG